MIGEATTIELSPTGIDGDNFDVFSSLRDGADGEEFSSGVGDIGEEATAGVDEAAGKLDLMAVAGGKAELDTFMDDSTDLEDMPALVDALSLASKSEINSPENRMSDERKEKICQGVASAACASCAASGTCSILRMINFADENLQPAPERESYLSELLNNNDDSIVVAGYVNSNDGEANTISTEATKVSEDRVDESNEQMVSQEQECKALTNETVESLGDDIDTEAAEVSNSSKKIEMHIVDAVSDAVHDYNKQSTPIVIEADPVVPIVEDAKKVNDDFVNMVVSDVQASPQIEVKEPKLVKAVDTADSLSPVSPVEVPSREMLSHNTTADDTGDYNNSHDMVSEVEEKSALPAIEQEVSAQAPEPSVDIQTEDVKCETPAKEVVVVEAPMPVDVPVVHEAVEVVPTENAAIEPEALTPIIPVETIVDEDELWTDPPQGGSQELVVNQTVYEAQTPPVEQFDDAAIEKRSCDTDEEVWAEEDVVFFVEQSSVVEPEAPLTEVVTTGPLTEATIVTSEDIDEPEVFVADEIEIESIEPLDNLQLASVPEIIKDDYEPVEQFVVPVPPTTKSVPTVELKEALAQALEKDGLPREKPADVIMTTSGENNLWYDDEIKTAVMEIGDVRSDVELPPERLEEPVSDEELTESAELELDEPDELATDAASDEYNYSSEVSVADEDSLIIKNHPSLGLWMDDSWLNPEDNRTPATGSTSVISWLTKLVGVVAVYVVYSGRENNLSLG